MILKTKVGEHVDIRTIAKQVIIEKDGIAKAADFVQAGIHAADVVNMCNAGYLDRIRHGYYQLAEADTSSEEQLIVKWHQKLWQKAMAKSSSVMRLI